jgi:hypothetical protein
LVALLHGENTMKLEPVQLEHARHCGNYLMNLWTPIKPSLCACLGPLNGEQYCNCTMVQKQLPRSEGHIRQQEELKARILQELDAVEKGLNSK